MQWSEFFDRLGRLESAIFAVVGFAIAYAFDLARESRQREWERAEQRRSAQREAIGGLQVHLSRVVKERIKAAILDKAIRDKPLEERIETVNQPWFEEMRAAERGLRIAISRIENEDLCTQANAVYNFPMDWVPGDKASVDEWRSRYRALGDEVLMLAGDLYRSLDSPPLPPERRWFWNRV
jgi:hypothetical protein